MSGTGSGGVGVPLGYLSIGAVSFGHGATHWTTATFYLLLPFIKEELGLSYAEAGLLVSVLHLCSLVANFPSGTMVDVTGRRTLYLVVTLGLCALALAGLGIGDRFAVLALSVALIGWMTMFWHPPAIAYLSEHFPARRGFVLSAHALGASVGDAAAPVAAGTCVVWLGWQGTAFLNALVPLVAALLILAMLRGSDRYRPREGGPGGRLRAYLGGIGELVGSTQVWAFCLMAGFRSMGQAGLIAFLPLYLVNDLGIGPFWLGVTLMQFQLAGALAMPVAGLAADRMGPRPVVQAGLWGTTVVVVALTLLADARTFVAGVAVLGFFTFSIRPVVHSWAIEISPERLSGSAIGIVFGSGSAFSAVIPVIGGLIADSFGLVWVFYMLAVTLVVANAFTLLVPGRGKG